MTAFTSVFATLTTVFAGIGWEPEIRGALTVAVGSAVLMGSVWMILVTNSGVRLGSLIALAGFFGWMFLMGVFWWIYGIGWVGSTPVWEVKEFNSDPAGFEVEGVADAVVGPVNTLPDTNCNLEQDLFPDNFDGASWTGPAANCTPRAIALLMAWDDDRKVDVLQELLNPQLPENRVDAIREDGITNTESIFAELLVRSEREIRTNVEVANATIPEDDARFMTPSQVDGEVQSLVDRRNTRVDDITLSAMAAIAPDLIEWAEDDSRNYIDYGDWNLLSTAQSGEAVATADAALKNNAVFGTADAQFVVLDAFQQGGKPARQNDDTLSRIWHKITSTVRLTHPTNYAVVQTQFAVQQEAQPGELPPLPEVEPEASTVSVIMERNLGNLRVVPALMSLVSLLLFLATCLVLHLRDLTLTERLANA